MAINSSLMTLGRCLEALRWNQQQQHIARAASSSSAAAPAPLRVVPYRESKVTHLFRDALHGYGHVVLSVNVAPCAKDYDETSHVLRYAALATQIGTLQQAEAPRRTIKAVTPSALRRAKRKAAAKAKAGAEKKAKKGAGVEKENEFAVGQVSAAEQCLVSTVTNSAMEGVGASQGMSPPEVSFDPGRPSMAGEVVYEVIGRIDEEDMTGQEQKSVDCQQQEHARDAELLACSGDEAAMQGGPGSVAPPSPCNLFGGGSPAEAEPIKPMQMHLHGTPCTGIPPSGVYGDEGTDTPSTPTTGSDVSNDAVAALQAQVQQLLQDLQAAEERAVVLEGEVREEVAAEMGQLLKDMEESYRERLAAEVSAAEARAAAAAAAGGGKASKGRNKGGKAGAASQQAQRDSSEDARLAEQRVERAEQGAVEARELAASLQAELELHKEEALVQAERLARAERTAQQAQAALAAAQAEAEATKEALATEQERCAALEAALNDMRRKSEDLMAGAASEMAQQLREEVTQLRANQAMQIEMAEQQAERLRKENAALRRRLEAAMTALESVSSPSASLMQRMVAACPPGGGGAGIAGTPHDIALAWARQAAALEDAAVPADDAKHHDSAQGSKGRDKDGVSLLAEVKCSGGSGAHKQRSRFAEEAAAAGELTVPNFSGYGGLSQASPKTAMHTMNVDVAFLPAEAAVEPEGGCGAAGEEHIAAAAAEEELDEEAEVEGDPLASGCERLDEAVQETAVPEKEELPQEAPPAGGDEGDLEEEQCPEQDDLEMVEPSEARATKRQPRKSSKGRRGRKVGGRSQSSAPAIDGPARKEAKGTRHSRRATGADAATSRQSSPEEPIEQTMQHDEVREVVQLVADDIVAPAASECMDDVERVAHAAAEAPQAEANIEPVPVEVNLVNLEDVRGSYLQGHAAEEAAAAAIEDVDATAAAPDPVEHDPQGSLRPSEDAGAKLEQDVEEQPLVPSEKTAEPDALARDPVLLPDAADPEDQAPQPRKRGRPRKRPAPAPLPMDDAVAVDRSSPKSTAAARRQRRRRAGGTAVAAAAAQEPADDECMEEARELTTEQQCTEEAKEPAHEDARPSAVGLSGSETRRLEGGEGQEQEAVPEPEPEAAKPAAKSRRRRLLQPAKVLSAEMRCALGELSDIDAPRKRGGLGAGKPTALELGLSPAPTRPRSPTMKGRRHAHGA